MIYAKGFSCNIHIVFIMEHLLKAKEVKEVVETDISRAAKGFAEDSTNIKYR